MLLKTDSIAALTAWGQPSLARILAIDDNPSIHRDFDLVLQDELCNPALEAEEERLYAHSATPPVAKPVYELEHAFSGLEGVEKIAQALAADRPYQLAFVDIRMPGIDGVETIERLWKIDPRVQVVICTAFADYSWDDLARRLGPTDNLLVLKKPFDAIEVTQLASTLTQKWFLARQAALKLEEMELLVARRTEKLLMLQQAGTTGPARPGENLIPSRPELPLVLVAGGVALQLLLSETLGGEYRVMCAEGQEAAFDQARETVPDLIVAESASPTSGALTLCRRLQGEELASHIPFILVGEADAADLPCQAIEAGADQCLLQPLNPAILKTTVERLLHTRAPVPDPLTQATLHAREIAANRLDAAFLRRAVETVQKHLSDYEFDVEALARNLAVSRRQLFRKLKAVTGDTPHTLIRTLRLNRAAQLLRDSEMTVTEITYAVGFADLKHFREVFREHFGVLPGDFTEKPKVAS